MLHRELCCLNDDCYVMIDVYGMCHEGCYVEYYDYERGFVGCCDEFYYGCYAG